MNAYRRVCLLVMVAIALPACGDGGDETTIITGGGTTISGTVTPASGTASGIPVLVHVLSPDGKIIATIGAAITDGSGNFTFSGSASVSTNFLLQAVLSSGSLFAYISNATGQAVSPVTTGVYDVISLIVSTPGERFVSHYTPAEVNTITTQASSDLATAGTDLSDRNAVRQEIIDSTGGLIADLSEGSFAAGIVPNPVSVDPPDVTAGSSPSLDLNDGGGELWDIQSDGSISDGTNDSYDGMFRLQIDGSLFPSQGSGVTEDTRELRKLSTIVRHLLDEISEQPLPPGRPVFVG